LTREEITHTAAPKLARSSAAAHRSSVALPLDQVVQALIVILGDRLAAKVAGVQDARTVRRWAKGEHTQRNPQLEQRLRCALMIAHLIGEYDSREVVQSWFQGINPSLNDRVPVTVLRDEQDPEAAQRDVLRAARAFIAH
jgi:hypothetical protein